MLIPRDRFINKVRELDYKYKRSGDKVDLWKKKGNTHTVGVRRNQMLDERYVRSTLRQCGCDDDDIEKFVSSCNC